MGGDHDDLEITISGNARLHVVDLDGVVDASTSPRLRDVLIDLTDSGTKRIEIDLRDVELLDSSAIGAMAEAYRRGVDVVVSHPSPMAMRQLVMSGVDRVFRVKP